MSFDLEEAFAAARRRVHARIDVLEYDARKEIAILAESARRSIGQRLRYWQEARRALHGGIGFVRDGKWIRPYWGASSVITPEYVAAQAAMNRNRARMMAELAMRVTVGGVAPHHGRTWRRWRWT